MPFITSIISRLKDIEDDFYWAYREVYDWIYPFFLLSYPLLYVSRSFGWLAYYFGEFRTWLYWAEDELESILSWSNIRSLIRSWLPDIELMITWWHNWETWFRQEIESWIQEFSQDVKAWVDEAEAWATSLFNSLSASLTSLQADWDTFTSSTLPNLANWNGVDSLINSRFIEFSPFWEGWLDWRDKVTEFFSDPEQWLYNAVDRIIERYW